MVQFEEGGFTGAVEFVGLVEVTGFARLREISV